MTSPSDPHPLAAALLTPSDEEEVAAADVLLRRPYDVPAVQAHAALTAALATPERRALVEDVAAVIRAAEAGYARTMCGCCDAGLPMGCTCTPMDTALASLTEQLEGQ